MAVPGCRPALGPQPAIDTDAVLTNFKKVTRHADEAFEQGLQAIGAGTGSEITPIQSQAGESSILQTDADQIAALRSARARRRCPLASRTVDDPQAKSPRVPKWPRQLHTLKITRIPFALVRLSYGWMCSADNRECDFAVKGVRDRELQAARAKDRVQENTVAAGRNGRRPAQKPACRLGRPPCPWHPSGTGQRMHSSVGQKRPAVSETLTRGVLERATARPRNRSLLLHHRGLAGHGRKHLGVSMVLGVATRM